MNRFVLDRKIEITQISRMLEGPFEIKLSDEAVERVKKCRSYLEEKLRKEKQPFYGINTGFGALYNVTISTEKLGELQHNLVVSHACGTGNTLPHDVIRLMLAFKVQSLIQGHSGVQLSTVQRLVELLNNDILPVVFEQGSLGASGDLAPLAHLCLPLIGLGEVYYNGERRFTEEVYSELGWEPLQLGSKEGLALLNGTQFMSALGAKCLTEADRLIEQADMIAALSLDAFDGRIEPFNPLIHKIRPHKGQAVVAENISRWLEKSEIIAQEKPHVQDPYSFRCIPQVHGASRDALEYAREIILTEINSVTDNPTIFPDEDLIISAGNFHGQPLAIALDLLAIAVAEAGSISERRTFKLLSGQRGLPVFLADDPGLNSGYMIPQYTSASIVSQNKQLCTPASVDTIDSSNGQEDHVSMGANAATKACRVIQNVKTILAIELMNASQAIESRKPLKTSVRLEKLLSEFRNHVPVLKKDEVMYNLIEAARNFLSGYTA